MNKITPILLALILVVVTINLALTFALVNRQTSADDAQLRIPTGVARDWGEKVTGLYNRQDYIALHGLFSPGARSKITVEQLEGQLQKLHQLFGQIRELDYLNSIKIGEKGVEQYFQLFFNLRVGEPAQRATMKLSLVVESEQISLYGMTINQSQGLD